MRIVLFAAFFALSTVDLFLTDGERDGRRGNALYEEGSFVEAAEAYAAGLAVLSDDASRRLRYGLLNNLGAALLKSGDAAGALGSFERALREADTPADATRTAYNAGNAAYATEDLEAALEFYKESLRRAPENRDAKFNYEFVKRQLEEQERQQQQQQDQQQGSSGEPQENQQNPGEQGENEPEQDQEQQSEPQPDEQRNAESEQQQGEPQQQDEDEGQPEPQPQNGRAEDRLDEEQAERILQALQNEEQQLLREVQRPVGRPRQVEKDW